MEGGSANDYDYCNGDPVNGFDLDGLCTDHKGFFGAVRDIGCNVGEGDVKGTVDATGRAGTAALDNRVVRGVATSVVVGTVCGATGGVGCVLLVGGAAGAGLGGLNASVNNKKGGITGGVVTGAADGLRVGAGRLVLGVVFQEYGNVGWIGVPTTVGGSITIAGLRSRVFR